MDCGPLGLEVLGLGVRSSHWEAEGRQFQRNCERKDQVGEKRPGPHTSWSQTHPLRTKQTLGSLTPVLPTTPVLRNMRSLGLGELEAELDEGLPRARGDPQG